MKGLVIILSMLFLSRLLFRKKKEETINTDKEKKLFEDLSKFISKQEEGQKEDIKKTDYSSEVNKSREKQVIKDNVKELDEDKRDKLNYFDLKRAVIYSSILNKHYN